MSAIAYDFVYMSRAFGAGEEMSGTHVSGPFYVVVGLVSLPFDCAFDVILLPFDIVAWIAGRKRSWPASD